MTRAVLFKREVLLKEQGAVSIPRPKMISLLKKLIDCDHKLFFLTSSAKKDDLFFTLLANENIFLTTVHTEANFFEELQEAKLYYLTDEDEPSLNFTESKFHKIFDNLRRDQEIIEKITTILHERRLIEHSRDTKETQISLELNLDGNGKNQLATGIGFFDHMLDLLAKHANFDLKLKVEGDLEVDEHHTIEDTAIALGEGIKKALGDKKGITRYAFSLPMDESSAHVLLDISNRPFLKFNAHFTREKVGDFPTEMVEHFYYSFALAAGITLHVELNGKNDHHQIEGGFKALAKCLEQAAFIKNNSLPSTKGKL